MDEPKLHENDIDGYTLQLIVSVSEALRQLGLVTNSEDTVRFDPMVLRNFVERCINGFTAAVKLINDQDYIRELEAEEVGNKLRAALLWCTLTKLNAAGFGGVDWGNDDELLDFGGALTETIILLLHRANLYEWSIDKLRKALSRMDISRELA